MDVSCVILAGGKSSRMGRDKSMLSVGGVPLVEFIKRQLDVFADEILVGANDLKKYSFLGCPVICDIEHGCGPIMGIYSCVLQSRNLVNFVTGCDIPVMNIDFIKELLSYSNKFDIVVPVDNNGYYEPLFAIYNKNILPAIEKVIKAGKRRIVDIFDDCSVKTISLPQTGWYRNLNTFTDFQEFNKSIKI